MNPAISVIIPVYNGTVVVERAIESALAQTYAPVEVLVVDDGSTDGTVATVSRFRAPVQLLRQANSGPAAARNHGARQASGSWLAFLDADDTWNPRKLEVQVAYADRPRTGIVHCYTQLHNIPKSIPTVTFDRLWHKNRITLSTALVLKEAFWEFGGFDEARDLISVEDYNLWLRMTAGGWKVVTVPEALCLYTPEPNSLTAQTSRFANAELANVERLSRALRLDPGTVRNKLAAVYEQYGREFFYERDLATARLYFCCALRGAPSLSSLLWLGATHLPGYIIDLRRKLRHVLLG